MSSFKKLWSSRFRQENRLEAAGPRGLNLIRNLFRDAVPPQHREKLVEFSPPPVRLRSHLRGIRLRNLLVALRDRGLFLLFVVLEHPAAQYRPHLRLPQTHGHEASSLRQVHV